MVEFKIRTYSKQELALLYFPQSSSPHVAVNHLVGWIKRCRDLYDDLDRMGYNRYSKFFSSREVKAIVEKLGEP